MKKEEKTPPVLQALVLADHIYTDESGKRVICGTFNRLFAQQFPGFLNQASWVFILLGEVMGEIELQLRFVHLKDNRTLMESARMKIRTEDPLTPADIAIQVPPLPLPEAGVYGFECYADDMLIGTVRLHATLLAQRENKND